MKHIGWVVADTLKVIELGVYSCYRDTFSSTKSMAITKYDEIYGKINTRFKYRNRKRKGLSACIKVYAQEPIK